MFQDLGSFLFDLPVSRLPIHIVRTGDRKTGVVGMAALAILWGLVTWVTRAEPTPAYWPLTVILGIFFGLAGGQAAHGEEYWFERGKVRYLSWGILFNSGWEERWDQDAAVVAEFRAERGRNMRFFHYIDIYLRVTCATTKPRRKVYLFRATLGSGSLFGGKVKNETWWKNRWRGYGQVFGLPPVFRWVEHERSLRVEEIPGLELPELPKPD